MKNNKPELPEDVFILEETDEIDRMYENKPDKRTKAYKEWKKEFNIRVDRVNKWVCFKMYSSV